MFWLWCWQQQAAWLQAMSAARYSAVWKTARVRRLFTATLWQETTRKKYWHNPIQNRKYKKSCNRLGYSFFLCHSRFLPGQAEGERFGVGAVAQQVVEHDAGKLLFAGEVGLLPNQLWRIKPEVSGKVGVVR